MGHSGFSISERPASDSALFSLPTGFSLVPPFSVSSSTAVLDIGSIERDSHSVWPPRILLMLLLFDVAMDSLSPTSIPGLKARWQCRRYSWHLALRSKSGWR